MENNKTNNRRGKKNFRRKGNRPKPEFDQKMVDLARVTRVVKGGRRFAFRATMVIGNRKGKVGYGVAKGPDVSTAISKAVAIAKKQMQEVKRTNTTISFEIKKKLGAAKILIKPAKKGRGIVAGGAMRSVLELAGIKDVVAKSMGTSNKINVVRATISALEELSLPMVKQGVQSKEARSATKKEVKKVVSKKTEKKAEGKPVASKKSVANKTTKKSEEKPVAKKAEKKEAGKKSKDTKTEKKDEKASAKK